MDEKLEPVEANSGRTKTRTARRKAPRREPKNPKASQVGSPSPASRKKSGPRRQSASDNSPSGARKSSKREAASGARLPQDASNNVRSGARKPSKRRTAFDPGLPPSSSPDVAIGLRELAEHIGASVPAPQSSFTDPPSGLGELPEHEGTSTPPPQSSSNDAPSGMGELPEHQGASVAAPRSPSNDVPDRVLGGMRLWPERKTATAVLLVVALAACLALASHYGEHRGEPMTSVPVCDDGSCSSPAATAAVADSHLEEIPKPQPVLPACDDGSCSSAAPDAAVADHHPDEAPIAGRAQNADKPRPPALYARVVAPGVVMSRRTGARARVGIAHAPRFQAYIDDLESNHGARIFFIGGIRPGHCASSSLHPCGRALDVCQLRRGVVDQRCHLPPRRKLAQIASSHGLFEGGRWCDSDYGHVQLGATAGDCGDRRTRFVRRRHAPEAGRDAFAAF